MDGGRSNKRQAEARPEVESSAKRQNVTMGAATLDCPTCSKPLSPPIFQYPKGDFICSSCCGKLPKSERTAFKRCYGMERVVNSIFVRCKHGCATKITSYEKKEHEKGCPCGPCFCPVSGCRFAGKTRPLLDHLTTLHKLPTKTFKYFVPFDLLVQPGSLVLRGGYGRLFLLEVASLEPLGHSVSLVCACRNATIGTIKCSVGFSCFEGHYQLSTLELQSSSLLPDALPTQYFCVVPKVSGEQTDVMIRIMIDLMYNHDEELEEEDNSDDSSYNQDEDDNTTAEQRMVVRELVVKKYADDNIYVEEDDDNSSEESDDEDTIITTWMRWMVTMTDKEEKEDGKDDGADDHNGD
ncbi:hypothetical protein ACQ4PT_041908 [Festuca glaucescens]